MLRLIGSLILVSGVFAGSCTGPAVISDPQGICTPAMAVPDCAWIDANKAELCNGIMGGWSIANGPECSLKGKSYGCYMQDYLEPTTSSNICCPQTGGAPTSVTGSASASASAVATPEPSDRRTDSSSGSASGSGSASRTSTATEPPWTITAYSSAYNTLSTTVTSTASGTRSATSSRSASVSAVATASASATAEAVFTFDSLLDYSNQQGKQGFTYGFYDSAGFKEGTYGNGPYATNAWQYSPSCYGSITNQMIMTGSAISCNTVSCGYLIPTLRWNNPFGLVWDMNVHLEVSHARNCGDGITVELYVNGAMVKTVTDAPGGTIGLVYTQLHRNVASVEFRSRPAGGCDCDQAEYRLAVTRMKATQTQTLSGSPSSTKSSTGTASASATFSMLPPVIRPTTSASPTNKLSEVTISATGTSYFTESNSLSYSSFASASGSGSSSATCSASSSSSGSATGSTMNSRTGTGTASATSSETSSSTASATGSATSSSSSTSSSRASSSARSTKTATPSARAPPKLPTNLSSLNLSQIDGLFQDFAGFDAKQIGPSLKKLGVAALNASGSKTFSVTTDSFQLEVQAIGATAATIATETVAVEMPAIGQLFSDAEAATLIEWTGNPYADGGSKPDTSTISLTVLDGGGDEVLVQNLTNPVSIGFKLNISADDWRLTPAPIYHVRCDSGDVFIDQKETYRLFTNYSRYDNTWSLPCLGGVLYNVSCVSRDNTLQTLTCPGLKIERKCLYWDNALNDWSSEGCQAVGDGVTSMICNCTHLTDFSARVEATIEANKAVFSIASSVYTLDGLRKYAQWFGIFGGIGAVSLLLGVLATRIDYVSTRRYVDSLVRNKYVSEILKLSPNTPIYVYDKMTCMREIMKRAERRHIKYEEAPPVKLSFLGRILMQHTRLNFFFRYDPRLNRIFRVITLFVIQFHSLFITAVLYGFTYAGSDMRWYDSIILALITTALNLPVVRTMFTAMNRIGMLEFKFLYPMLYAEYDRRREFEKLALVYIFNKKTKMVTDDGTSENLLDNDLSMYGIGDEDGGLLDLLAVYLCCRTHKDDKENDDLLELPQRTILKMMAGVMKDTYPYIEGYNRNWGWLPCQTWQGGLFLACSFGWLAWCLNYLLLFAAANQEGAGASVMTSYAISEITTIFLTQPLIIGATFGLFWVCNRYPRWIPERIRRFFVVSDVRKIPSLYYFSDPWNRDAKTSLTSEFAYNVLVKAPAVASGTSEYAYAPIRAAAANLVNGEHNIEVKNPDGEEVNALYTRMADIWKEMQSKARV